MVEEIKYDIVTCPDCLRSRDAFFIDCPFCDMQYKFIKEKAERGKLGLP
jgi:hypothetical protein